MKYTYAAYAGLDPASRQKVREIIDKGGPDQFFVVKLMFEILENDPAPDARQWALAKLGQLGIGITDHQTIVINTPDHKLTELNGDKGRVHDRAELMNQSLYLIQPKDSRAYLAGKATHPTLEKLYPGISASGKLLLGQNSGAGKEQVGYAARHRWKTDMFCYSFLTPEAKLIIGEHGGLTEAQYRDRPAPGTSVAVLYANEQEYDVL